MMAQFPLSPYRIAAAIALVFLSACSALQAQDTKKNAVVQCSTSKTNKSCVLILDRANPVAPPTIQMYSEQKLTVIVKHARTYERYFLDLQSAQGTAEPDVASNIVQGLFGSLAKLQEFNKGGGQAPTETAGTCANMNDPAWPPATMAVADTLTTFQGCLGLLNGYAVDAYQKLEPYAAPDSVIPGRGLGPSEDPDSHAFDTQLHLFLDPESQFSAKVSTIAANRKAAADAAAVDQLMNLQKLADGVATDLLDYDERILDLKNFSNGGHLCEAADGVRKNDEGASCVKLDAIQDDKTIYDETVTRTVNYAVDVLNMVVNTREAVPTSSNKKSMATVVINYADEPNELTALRWEVSAGVFFSALPNRTFTVTPTYSGTTVNDNTIKQNLVLPTPIPFAAANLRLTNDLPGRWKSNLYWTAAIGINPNTTTADFGTGFSYAWRALMISALCHFGHDTHLTQGFTNDEDLGTSFSGTLPTKTYWRGAIAFGVSVRVPSLTGR